MKKRWNFVILFLVIVFIIILISLNTSDSSLTGKQVNIINVEAQQDQNFLERIINAILGRNNAQGAEVVKDPSLTGKQSFSVSNVEGFAGQFASLSIGDEFFLDLPPNKLIIKVKQHIQEANSNLIYGTVENEEGFVILKVKEDYFIGYVTTPETTYFIQRDGNFMTWETSSFPEEYGAIDPPEDDGDDLPGDPISCDPPSPEIMIVYTSLARDAAGGTTNIEDIIDLAVEATNIAYLNSEVDHRIRLVHTSEIDYDEVIQPNDDYSEHVIRLRKTADGFMDEVHAWRDENGADMVQLIVADDSACGAAYLMGPDDFGSQFEPYAFSAATWFCAAGQYTTAHEFGHNLGAVHEHELFNLPPVFDYAYGKRWMQEVTSIKYKTVMAISSSYSRIPHFSNPDVAYEGTPTGNPFLGTDPADNKLTFEDTAPVAANFRCSVQPPVPPTLGVEDAQAEI